MRSRRTVLAVPGSNMRMLQNAQSLDADEVFLDLEDAVAVDAKDEARSNIITVLRDGDWSGKTVALRVNDWTTPWTYRDVIEVVSTVGDCLDTVILPKADSPHHVAALDLLLTQVESTSGQARRIG